MPEEMESKLNWYSPKEEPFQLAGFAWLGTDNVYRRLLVEPEHPLPDSVNSLADSTAGGQIRFQTDSQRLAIRVQLAGPPGMYHMPPTGQCGFDCYLGPVGSSRYCSTSHLGAREDSYECDLFSLPTAALRQVTLNFPLYQGVKEVTIGLEDGSDIQPPPPYDNESKVVVYGTSITQGGCACRPGMAYTNILSRHINLEFINLGFSGSGRGEPEVAHTMAAISTPACYVLDYEANSGEGIRNTLHPFIEILRSSHPVVPILVVSKIRYAAEQFNKEADLARESRKEFQRQTVEELRKAGDDHIFFKDGTELLDDRFDECTVDGVHPSDLGFQQMADGLFPALQEILEISGLAQVRGG